MHYKILSLWSFGNDNWTLHQANSIYKYIPPPSYSSSSSNYILQPHSNLQKLLTLSSTWVYFSAFQYTKLPHTRLAVLMMDTLVKGSSKQVYLHTSSQQGECPSIFWIPVVLWVFIQSAQTTPPYVMRFLIHYPRDTGSTTTSKHHLYLPEYKTWWKTAVCCTIRHGVKHVLHEYFPRNWIFWKGIIL